MKKKLILIVFLGATLVSSAQESWPDSTYKHEVGVDVSLFLRQFLGRTDSNGTNVPNTSPYWFTYRYHMGSWNLRFAVGGYINNDERPIGMGPDTYHIDKTGIDLRLGVEHTQKLGKRWQVFYGLDLRPGWSYSNRDYTYSNNFYRYGEEIRESNLGVAPLLGIRYRITPRFSILTETSVNFVASNVENRRFSEPTDDAHPPMPDNKWTTNSFNTVFMPPLSIVATFDL